MLSTKHTQTSITQYLQNLVLHRYTIEQFNSKIKNDFDLQEFSIYENDCETLEENDDSYIFTLTFKELLVDVTLYYIYTNQTDTFIVTEVAYEICIK